MMWFCVRFPKNPWFYAVGNFDLSAYLACCCGILKDRRVVMALLVTCKCVCCSLGLSSVVFEVASIIEWLVMYLHGVDCQWFGVVSPGTADRF